MNIALLLAAFLAAKAPEYDWYGVSIPKDIRPETIAGGAEIAVRADGERVLLVTTRGAALYDSRRVEAVWRRRFSVKAIRDVAFLDDQRAVFTTWTEIVQLSLDKGNIIRRARTRLETAPLAVTSTGHLLGSVPRDDKRGWTHALVCPDDGKTFFEFGDVTGSLRVLVTDRTGTRFATGGLPEGVGIGDVYTRTVRDVVRRTGGSYAGPACFDPTGRYLAVIWGAYCQVGVFDLLGPMVWDADKSPGYLGKFGRPRRPGAGCGIGFVDDRWLWFTFGKDLYFCTWPEKKVLEGLGPPSKADCFVWKASLDGHQLVALDHLGEIWFGRLAEPERPNVRRCVPGAHGENVGRGVDQHGERRCQGRHDGAVGTEQALVTRLR